jgi:hypothetical protein
MSDSLQWQELVQPLNQLEPVQIIDLAPYEPLEDTQQTLHLSTLGNEFAPAHEERTPYAGESGDVAALFPKSGREEWCEERLVCLGKTLRSRVELE